MTSLDRLAVFIDYQNAYMGARQAFGTGQGDPHIVGQFNPLELARLIARRHPNYSGANLRQLVQVSIYRGLPSGSRSPTGYAAARRQVSRWQSYGAGESVRLDVQTRPLDYRMEKPREKGIDVLLALDLAFGATNREFDVVVLFSGDSDLLPALERADAGGVACESASWQGGGRRLPQKSFLKCEHQLTQLDYTQVQDPVDYR